MDFGITPVLLVGGAAVLCGLSYLILLVGRDLAPVSGLVGPRRWWLVAGLGAGVFAFSIKLAAIALIAQLRPAHPDTSHVPRADVALPSRPVGDDQQLPPLWRALPEVAPAPAENPTTPEKVALGRRLFLDARLSKDGTLSCASCHDLDRGGADKTAFSSGVGGMLGGRNAPTVYNAAFQTLMFWDGRAHSLEEQAGGPLLNPVEMAMQDEASVVERVVADATYAPAFAAAFGDSHITFERITQAIAAFERTLITPDAPFDRFVKGDSTALSPAQVRGMALFQEVGCIECHAGPNFSEASVFTPGYGFRLFPAVDNPTLDPYTLRADKGASPGERGVFRVPSLRNVALTAPYLHNGSVPTLREAVRIMAASQRNVSLSEDVRGAREVAWQGEQARLAISSRRVLTPADIEDIVAFLNALTSERLSRASKEAAR